MQDAEKAKIEKLKNDDLSVLMIAERMQLSVNTVKSYLRRSEIKESKISLCPVCNKKIVTLPHKKTKKYCSDKCRMIWWNTHLSKVQRKAFYSFVCQECGKEFEAYGNNHRKYCSRGCFANARRKTIE